VKEEIKSFRLFSLSSLVFQTIWTGAKTKEQKNKKTKNNNSYT
jgi:hypothetical protein